MTKEEYVNKQGRTNEYELGLQDGLDIAEKFADWCIANYENNCNGWFKEDEIIPNPYTTSELFTKYLETIK